MKYRLGALGALAAPEIPDAIIEKGSRGASGRTHENKSDEG
jgi:hypothetical protein